MSFFGVLCLIFVTLKLIGIISWSWWLVLLPLYGGFVFGLVVWLLIIVGYVSKTTFKTRRK